MSAFFIDRPVFAWVVAILILLGGGVATRYLAVEQYPNVAPPRVGINASYPGASPEVAERTVTAVIERELAGIPGLLYFTSSSAEGQVEIGLAFDTGTDTRLATVEVQNRIKRVEERLPESLRRQGISVEQSDESELMFITLDADNPTVDDVQLGDFATTQVRP
ncbi:efflux RND transporter permease subunit, partial [Pseudomonas aeruginosa]|nr:efflux RND transporter permease subunit [Pseudomonas aeruginosa]